MNEQAIYIENIPVLKNPLLIAGFDGWGNALSVATDMVDYLVRKLGAEPFARINPDIFYRYDQSRPIVDIEDGTLRKLKSPGGTFFAARTGAQESDLVILKADEPALHWHQFTDELYSMCRKLGGQTAITLGSMYDNVLHSDRVISGMASGEEFFPKLKNQNVHLISYHGPSAIHSIIHSEGTKMGFDCLSLWCHCPYYLQGTSHFGLLIGLSSVLCAIGGFGIDSGDLEQRWKKLNKQIQELIEHKPDLRDMINKLRKEKVRGSVASMKASIDKEEKIIDIKDFLDPKLP
jgi:proteasome assembly chaperone (PAC2) family protein